ncbi:MAG: hypothetical protein ABJH72_22345 [Reichenbachiella sp.]|uniref:hypothetical protein n=1 Tax=Reichenbachiella sp. TaxID=2184521 RepID=UPI003264172C
MKKNLLLIVVSLISFTSWGQTNSFPSTGNAEIKSGSLLIETSTWRSSLLTLKDTHYSPNQIYHFQIESDGLKIKQDNNANYRFKSGGDFIVQNGKIGIGTNSPSSTLDVFGGLRTSTDQNRFLSIHSSSDGNSYINYTGGGSTSKLGFQIDGSSKMSLLDNGFLGIGNSAPEEKLHVSGNNRIDGSIILNSNGGDPYNAISFKHQENTKWLIDYGTSSTHNLRLLKFSSPTSASTFMNFNFDGNLIEFPSAPVAIATTSTGNHKLAVGGSIGAREIKVEASGWSDFVFYKGYELRTLEEVEKHIAEKGHLPEIPSEVEVTKNGINLGEMDAKLLQKIEELTLYLIEQNKEIIKMKKEISALKSK